MFDNIGGKIKTLAKVTCWIGIIASIIAAIVLWAIGSYLIGIGFAVLVGGVLVSWIGSFFVYGFGELIERTVSIDRKLNGKGNGKTVSETKTKSADEKREKLEKLRAQGLITEEEYRKALGE